MADPATTAASYRQQADEKRQMATRLTDDRQKKSMLKEAQALDDLAQTLEEAAPG